MASAKGLCISFSHVTIVPSLGPRCKDHKSCEASDVGTGVGYVVAFGGGVASFVSPCVLPVVPAYLSMITGLDFSEAGKGTSRHLGKIARDTGLFILGFGSVFVLIGLTATAVGSTLLRDRVVLTRVSGIVVIAMAAYLAGSAFLGLPSLYREARFHPRPSRLGPFAAPVTGAAFGFGWTPCLGPVLASVTAVAVSERGIGQGAALLAVYAAGLGVPFLVVGLGFAKVSSALRFLRQHSNAIMLISAVVLAFFGVLLVLDRLAWLTSELEAAMSAIGLGGLVRSG